MSISPIASGNSRFALDFQSVIDRSIAIASLPLRQLQSVRSQLSQQSSALESLQAAFSSLQSALADIEGATGLGSWGAAVSDNTIVSATIGSGALEGSYTIEVTSLGAYTSTMSKDGLTAVSDPYAQTITADPSLVLTVNGTAFDITPAGATLASLAEAINSSGAGVQAAIVNVGSNSAPDFRLTVQSETLGADTIQLSDSTGALLDTLATGAKATYLVNGRVTPVESDSRTITLAPGLTVELLGQSAPGQATTITVSREMAGVRDALSAFVDAYNAAADALDAQRGEKAGPLAGQALLSTLAGTLRRISTYSPGLAGLSTLSALGLELDQSGKLSFDANVFDSVAAERGSDVLAFLGSSSEAGFLKTANDVLQLVGDPVDGLLKRTIGSVEDEIEQQDDEIAAYQERVDQLRESLAAQMAAADALIASLEQQVQYMNGLFEAMRIATESMK